MKTKTDVSLMIDILRDAVDRSDSPTPLLREFSEKRELSLIYDFIDSKMIRGEVRNSREQVPIGAAMWGITLAGREYLNKLLSEQEESSFKNKFNKALWAIGGAVIGIILSTGTAIAGALALKLLKLE